MTEKYIDLARPILAEADNSNTTTFCLGVREALYWLDDHPDHVPRRTITEGEFDELVDALHQNWATPEYFSGVLSDALIDHGITVIPDPEPTNAEKLKAVLDAIGDSTDGYREHLARNLDEAGVKAPGADDD